MSTTANFSEVATYAAVFLLVAAILLKVIELFRFRPMKMLLQPALFEESHFKPKQASDFINDRLLDASTKLTALQSKARTNQIVKNMLVIGQYITGGLLASSFVQQSLTPSLVGVLGLLVLFSSLVYQHFRPDLQMRRALAHASKLRSTIRSVEDDLKHSEMIGGPLVDVDSLRRKLSSILDEIESSEATNSGLNDTHR